jgi:hypothetical protein
LKATTINHDVKPFIFFLSVSFALKSRIVQQVPYEIDTLKMTEASAAEVTLNKLPCNLLSGYQHFGGTHCLLQGPPQR